MMSKLKALSEALDGIEDGATVGIGGWIFNSQPMALVRELIRRNKRNLRLVPAPGSIAPDMLIGAGCVAETGCVFISFEQFGLAPHFRRAAEAGSIKIHELDGPAIAGGLRAAACDLPYGLIPDMCTDLPRVNPQTYQPVARVSGERAMLKVPAIHLDVLLLHAQQADELGNIQYFGPVFFDVLMAQAAKKVIVSVDRIVPTEVIRRSNHLTKLPSAFVHSVVEAPFGAHPTSSGGLYEADDEHLAEYVRASGGAASFEKYLETYVSGAADHRDYHKRIGSPQLRAPATPEAMTQP
jgi:glutaconate CoA-transferase subunit A